MAFVHISDVLLDQRRHLPSVSYVLNSGALTSGTHGGIAYEWQQNHGCPTRFPRQAAQQIQSDCGPVEGTVPVDYNQHLPASPSRLDPFLSPNTVLDRFNSPIEADVRSIINPHQPASRTQDTAASDAKVVKSRRTRTTISASTKARLKSWFEEKPYPDTDDIACFAAALNLAPKAVQTWFYNHRTRSGTYTKAHDPTLESMSLPRFHDGSSGAGHDLYQGCKQSDSQALPLLLERYLEVPCEQDPGMMALFSRDPCLTSDLHSGLLEKGADAFSHNSRTPSPAASMQGSEMSSTSASSCGSGYSVSSKPRRRGRRRHIPKNTSINTLMSSSLGNEITHAHATALHDSNQSQPTTSGFHEFDSALKPARYMISSREAAGTGDVSFRCTFCNSTFHNQYGWERHERSVHAPSTFYICNEYLMKETLDGLDLQAYFELLSNSLTCQSRPLADRVFCRKDHFYQHLFKCHLKNVSCAPAATEKLSALIVECSRAGPDIPVQHLALRCGFCGLHFSTFEERSKHVAKHFADRVHFSEWWTGRKAPQNAVLAIMWSCAHLGGPMDAYRVTGSGVMLCLYCRMEFEDTSDWTERIRHLHYQHRYRGCNQPEAHGIAEMEAHLQAEHHAGPLISMAQKWFLARAHPGVGMQPAASRANSLEAFDKSSESLADLTVHGRSTEQVSRFRRTVSDREVGEPSPSVTS